MQNFENNTLPILDEIKMRLENIESSLDSISNQKSQPIQAWLTTKQAALILGVTTRTLQTYRDQGDIPFSQFGREIRFRAEDIQDFLMAHYVKLSGRIGGLK
jgi:excisionase family DNA binding protein